MSDCCKPGTGFPSSTLMQQLALNHPVIWEEICMIQQAILAAASQCQVGGGQMCTTVGGTTPMTFISGIEEITVTSGGSGYFVDTPSVFFQPPVGATPSVTATGTVVTNGGAITGITITAQGAGYDPIPATAAVTSLTGTGAVIQPLVNAAGGIVGINIVSAGTGYTVDDTVTATRAVLPNSAYVNAQIRITTVGIAGEILAFAILNPGSGYQPSVTEAKIVSTLDPDVPYPLGTGFMGTVLVDGTGAITQVVVNNTGAGYAVYRPYLVISDPGSGAQTTVNLTGTAVSSITVNQPGTNYTTSATGTVFNPPTAALPNPPATPAVVDIEVSENTFGTNPTLYHQVWQGTVTNKQIQLQLNQVLNYFKGLGYSIIIQTNPATGSTIQWKICW
jgi:hypothetical protein